jgi:hypothetical protein
MRKALIVAAALTIPASAVLGALDATQALAGGPRGKVTCTSVNGSITGGTVTLSGCSDVNGANTGPASQPISIAVLASGGTVTWDSGTTSTFGAPALASTNAKHCPGYVKGASNEPSAEKFSGRVTADTSGLKVPGKFKGAVCISPSGTITALKPAKIS